MWVTGAKDGHLVPQLVSKGREPDLHRPHSDGNQQPSSSLTSRSTQPDLSRKQMNEYRLKKLTTFFLKPAVKVSHSQDDAGLATARKVCTELPDEIQGEPDPQALPTSPKHASEENLFTGSPAKARMWMDALPPPQTQIEAQAFNPLLCNQALHTSIASFPITGQPVLDNTKGYAAVTTNIFNDLPLLIVHQDIHRYTQSR